MAEINLSISRENRVISVSSFFKSGIIPDSAQYYRVNRVSRITRYKKKEKKRERRIGLLNGSNFAILYSLREIPLLLHALIHGRGFLSGSSVARISTFTCLLDFFSPTIGDHLSTSSRRILPAI